MMRNRQPARPAWRLGIGLILLGVALVAAGCSTDDGEVFSSTTAGAVVTSTTTAATSSVPATSLPEPSTTAAATTVVPTTLPASTVELVLLPVEQLATRNGPTISVSVAGATVGSLSEADPRVQIAVAAETEVAFAYVGSDGEATDVAWSQIVDPSAATTEVAQPWRQPDRDPEWHMLAWSRTADREAALAHVADPAVLSVVSPLWWFVDGEGVLSGSVDADFVEQTHAAGVAVWPAVQGIDADGLHILLSDAAVRREAAVQIAAEAEAVGADGVNIDIEGFRDEDSAAMSAFVEEVAEAVHGWGGVVSYDLVPRSDSWEVTPPELAYWSNAPERRRIAAAVDFTALMAYDQHNRFRPAGPVAAPNWVEEMLVYQLRYSDPQDILLGIPAYGRIWDPEELDAPRAVSLAALDGSDGERSPDPQFGVDRIDLADGRFYWAEQDVTADRMGLAVEYGLSGLAVWRIGLDYPGLWEAVP